MLEKAMATQSSTLAWQIPWMEEPGRLQSMGSLRVGHNRSDLAAAAVCYSPIWENFYALKWKKAFQFFWIHQEFPVISNSVLSWLPGQAYFQWGTTYRITYAYSLCQLVTWLKVLWNISFLIFNAGSTATIKDHGTRRHLSTPERRQLNATWSST